MPPRKQAESAHPVLVDEAQVNTVNLATAAEDEARELELALRPVPEADRERARSLLLGGVPVGAEDPETASHLQRLAVIRTARIRNEMAQEAARRSHPSMRVRLAVVDRLPMKGARAVVLRRSGDDVDGTVLLPSSGATGADVDLAMRALQRTIRTSASSPQRPSRIAIRTVTGANRDAAAYWSDVVEAIAQYPTVEVQGVGPARFTLVNVKLAALR